jgi:hypothetical protein
MTNLLTGKSTDVAPIDHTERCHDVTFISVDVESQENRCTIFYRIFAKENCLYEHPLEFSSEKLTKYRELCIDAQIPSKFFQNKSQCVILRQELTENILRKWRVRYDRCQHCVADKTCKFLINPSCTYSAFHSAPLTRLLLALYRDGSRVQSPIPMRATASTGGSKPRLYCHRSTQYIVHLCRRCHSCQRSKYEYNSSIVSVLDTMSQPCILGLRVVRSLTE